LVKQIKTAGKPARIELTADRRIMQAGDKDLSFVTARIVDKQGNLVPDADNQVHFTITGAGQIAGTDNGYQASLESFKTPDRKCWKGMAMVILRSAEKKGNITLKVVAEGLPPSFLSLENR
jgi:beta-galactosidase